MTLSLFQRQIAKREVQNNFRINIIPTLFYIYISDASVDTNTVVKDIEEAGAIGAGGMELLGLYNYGGSLAPQPAGADWATYGFGTPAFNAIFKASLQSAKSTGMIFDFALGPSQGQGVPANPNDEGLHWDLAPFNVSVPPNGAYNGQILGWGTGELVSLVSARVVNTSTVVNPASSLFSTPANNATRLVLAAGSLVDHTDAVSVDGKVSLSFNVSEHSTYRLFAYYQYQDLVKNLDIHESSTGSIFDNGSYTVDHFSARGAQTTIDFWENYILNDTDIKSLFQEVGRYGWEDSIEIKSNISWSPSLPGIFEQINGYQLGKYLPLVMYGNNNPGVQPSYPGNLECVLDRENQGQGYVNDFRDALEKGYQVYLDTLSAWLEGLGLGYSAQVSYNLPINMEVNINHVLAPECESLAFNNNIDGYRQFSGVANLANLAQKNVIPNEMGANLEKAFALPVSELLGQINTAFAGGVNQIVLHGQSYTGDYHKTTWPGYTFFFILTAESYYNKQPAWGHGFSDVINYISRNQYILQAGQPRTDIILYNRVSMTDLQLEALYSANNMINTDYTYTYLSPANSNLSQASVAGGLLAPHSPAYKAIVVTSDQNVTLAGVNKLQQYADAGLPVILSGEALRSSPSVYTTGFGQIALKLEQLNLTPRVAVHSNGTWYPVLRMDNNTDYLFIFSKESASQGKLTVSSTKTPYLLDSWTGKRSPFLHYKRSGNTTVIPLQLAANQTIAFAFSNELKYEIETPSLHASRVPSTVLGYDYSTSAHIHRPLQRLRVYVTYEPIEGRHAPPPNAGMVLVTRSPALHDGDIQFAQNVIPPDNHPLAELTNSIVFSSKGYRDLPSQLSGGDLDGDIFNVIWDTDAYPVRTFAPADYPRVSPVDIGRPVERDDMAQFFLDFMKTDHLGVIATRHMIMADQEAEGTSHPVCRKLAQLHSTAVDFSKTGIPVQMSEIPKGKPFRPDFMALGPVARIHNKSDIELEEYVIQAAYDEDDDMEPFHKYYRSEKILGKLYRGVDERQIWQEDIQSKVQPNEDEFWNEFLWSTLERCDKIGNLSWELWLDEARHIRLRYEEAVFSARNNYSEHPIDPLSELEVFIGSVMNKGVQTRRQRDQSNKLADEFDRISTWIVGQMRAGSSSESPITSVSDQLKPLEFCLACIHVGGESNKDPARRRREVYGEIKSFRVVAACALLFELDLIEKGRKRKF
ncbi:hypothetical protein M747DRAFT_316391 [Aspergillus niger ATCC 13496]|uniref:RNA-dependent RNA polymerase n=1 Tax=Aspergillus niger ATCC 13496 TaxID=1353008 RepID=A0A370BX02_ASPNG|nr:hypothetical protein ANI_1_2224074 [Aspergillus niger CBS 513.88]RDH18585.1 hypothetical protein M747DRAFT_316391 [Aspergillus niger ATCC 13496]|eukprot:XP_001392956.2 hypothetical protein ANI_1_2224074 [Aspergillus niger CBS 513.88]